MCVSNSVCFGMFCLFLHTPQVHSAFLVTTLMFFFLLFDWPPTDLPGLFDHPSAVLASYLLTNVSLVGIGPNPPCVQRRLNFPRSSSPVLLPMRFQRPFRTGNNKLFFLFTFKTPTPWGSGSFLVSTEHPVRQVTDYGLRPFGPSEIRWSHEF